MSARSSSASESSHSSTPTAASPPLKHPHPLHAVPAPETPVHPSFTLMTPTPPPSTTRPQPPAESPAASKAARKWRASPLTNELTNVHAHTNALTTLSDPHSSSSSATALAPSAVAAACSTNTPNPLQTTNVYINGLPANFKAEQLYALTAQFGPVLSCRTFTRQLSDHPSGYGFVLFETIDAAQQCIDVLRSHHNLHPTFAKQAHKITRAPATYVPDPALNLNPTVNPDTDTDTDGAADIYIEGLPMNVEIPTLRALLAPHVVRASRFFADTRVQPPQLVAFVQLTSRAAAHAVREKLHGRALRGYSARLDVSFAERYREDEELGAANANLTTTRGGPKLSTGLPAPAPAQFQDPFADDFAGPQQYSQIDPAPVPVPALQPISATLHELQLQLASLRPLLAAYQNQSQAAPPPPPHTHTAPLSLSSALNPNPGLSPAFTPSSSSSNLTPTYASASHYTAHAHARAPSYNPQQRPRSLSHTPVPVFSGAGGDDAFGTPGVGVGVGVGHTYAGLSAAGSIAGAGGGFGGNAHLSAGSHLTSADFNTNANANTSGNAHLSLGTGSGAHSRAHTTTGHGLGAALFPHPAQQRSAGAGTGVGAGAGAQIQTVVGGKGGAGGRRYEAQA